MEYTHLKLQDDSEFIKGIKPCRSYYSIRCASARRNASISRCNILRENMRPILAIEVFYKLRNKQIDYRISSCLSNSKIVVSDSLSYSNIVA